MSKKIEPVDASGVLPDYLGRKVRETFITITNTGDGLSQAMAIEPALFNPGEAFVVVLECVVDKHKHSRIKGDESGDLTLEQIFRAGTAVVLTENEAVVVRHALAAAADKLKRARERQEGVARLPYVEEILKEHELGLHETPLEGCDLCAPPKRKRTRKPKAEDNVKPISARRPRKIAGDPVSIGELVAGVKVTHLASDGDPVL